MPLDTITNKAGEFIVKTGLIYVSEFSGTLGHEFGHFLIAKARGMNPRLIMGVSSGKYDEDKLLNFDSANPSTGVTKSKRFVYHTKEHNKNILQIIAGPTFGILVRVIQLYILSKYENKLSSNIINGLSDFITAKIVGQIVYGFTPFFGQGDGANLFNTLHVKYRMQTDFFDNAKNLSRPFSIAKNKLVEFLFYYYIVHYGLKFIHKKKIFDKLEKATKNKWIHTLICYLKYQLVLDLTQDIQDLENNKSNWISKIALESLIF